MSFVVDINSVQQERKRIVNEREAKLLKKQQAKQEALAVGECWWKEQGQKVADAIFEHLLFENMSLENLVPDECRLFVLEELRRRGFAASEKLLTGSSSGYFSSTIDLFHIGKIRYEPQKKEGFTLFPECTAWTVWRVMCENVSDIERKIHNDLVVLSATNRKGEISVSVTRTSKREKFAARHLSTQYKNQGLETWYKRSTIGVKFPPLQ